MKQLAFLQKLFWINLLPLLAYRIYYILKQSEPMRFSRKLFKTSYSCFIVAAKDTLFFVNLQWALYVQKKPVVALSWLHQCWNEHRVVPQEPYKIPPFSGLRICVTKIPAG